MLGALACASAIACAVQGRAPRACAPEPLTVHIPEAVRRCPRALLEARRGGLEPGRYVPPDADARAALADTLAALGDGASVTAFARARAAEAGFEIVDVPELLGVVLVREREGGKRGGGAYVVRRGATSRVIVQTPHSFFDEETLPLGCELLDRAGARALFVETAHRYKSAVDAGVARGAGEAAGSPDAEDSHPADVAHAPSSMFQAATAGLLRAPGLDGGARAIVVQLHGFATREGGFAVVVSSGERRTGVAIVDRVARALASAVPGAVVRFPDDVDELGATTNVQGAIVRAAGGAFVHLELSSTLRRELADAPALRGRVLGALARSLSEAP
jgi:hypothetical protein